MKKTKKIKKTDVPISAQDLINAFPFYVILVDEHHHILMANEAVGKELGVVPEKIVGGYCPKVVHGVDESFPGCPLEEAVEKGGGIEKELFDPDSGRWMRSAIYPTAHKMQNGRRHYVHLVEDITAMKRLEEDIRKNYEAQKVLNSILDLSLRDVPLEESLGRALDLVISIPWFAFESRAAVFIVDERAEALVMIAQRGLDKSKEMACVQIPLGTCLCGKSARLQKIQFAGVLDDRNEMRCEGIHPHGRYCIPIVSEGKTLGVISISLREGSGHDHRDEEFLASLARILAAIINRMKGEESHARLTTILEATSDFVGIADIEGRAVYINRAGRTMVGLCGDENILNTRITDYHPSWAGDTIMSEGIPAAVRNGVWSGETVLLSGDGKEIPVLQVIIAHKKPDGTIDCFSTIARDITPLKQSETELRQSAENLRKTLEGSIKALASVLEWRDPYTAGHQQRVTHLACAVAAEMGLSKERIEGIRIAGTLHDVGKIIVPAEILSKPGKISDAEFAIIKTHPQVTYEILKDIEFPYPVAQIAGQHHERLNGSGYPWGLSGEAILLESRILAVADVVEAVSSHRPYRPALGMDKALEEILKNKGILYDPKAVDACVRLVREKKFRFDDDNRIPYPQGEDF